jgi:hypothetical protein
MVGIFLRALVLLLMVGGTLAPSSGAAAWAAPAADAASTLVVIDQPRGGASGPQIYVSGWAADPRGATGTGVDRVEVYLDGERGAGGTLLGRATYGLSRPDVAAHLGASRFALSGYALVADASPGPHTVYVYAHPSDQPADQGWAEPKSAAVMIRSGGPGPVAGGPPPGAPPPPGPPDGPAALGVPFGPPAPSGETIRFAGVTGSVTYGWPGPTGPYYPPGPADTGGPIYQPSYLGYGLYGGAFPFPDYPLYYQSAYGWVPPGFDFSLGYGYDFLSPTVFFPGYGYPGYSSAFDPGYLYRRHLPWYGPGDFPAFRSAYFPLYCPVYTYTFC